MKSINELLKRKPHPHQNCHFMYIAEDGSPGIRIFNPRNAPMPNRIVLDGKKYVILPTQILTTDHIPKPGEYITKDVTPEQLTKMINLALEEKERNDGKKLELNQIKTITKYMRDYSNRYGVLYKIPAPESCGVELDENSKNECAPE